MYFILKVLRVCFTFLILDEDVSEQDQLVRWIRSPCCEHLTNVNMPSVPYVCVM